MTIFNDDNKVKSNWFQKNKIGDSIEGTYIAKRIVMNQLRGKEQIIYELKAADGQFWNVGGGDPNAKFPAGIDIQMRNVKLGQVIGFKYTEDKPSTTVGMNPTKKVQVFANPDIVDEEWLKQQDDENAIEGGIDPDFGVSDKTVLKAFEKMDEATDDMIGHINKLAEEKLGAITPEEVKDMVAEKTGLAFIEKNLDKIVEALTALPAKKK